jgi:YggT family protein
VICTLVQIYVLCIIGRIIFSYFPLTPGSTGAQVFSFLYTITEPVLGPLRRIIPTAGPFDFSPVIAIIGIPIIAQALGIC